MGTTGLLSQLGDISNENRLHQRSRTELLGDQDRKQRADQITAALESARTYGTLTPEQQQQALDELHGLYNQPQHMPLLLDAVNRVKGAIRGAIHPNQPQAQPQVSAQPNLPVQPTIPAQAPSVESNTPGVNLSQLPLSAVVRPTFGGQPAMAQPSTPAPQKPMSIGDIIASSYPSGGTFGAQLQKMQKQIELQNAGKFGVAQINAFGKKMPIAGEALPQDAIGPDGQPIPANARTGPYVRQGFIEDDAGNYIPTYVRQAVRLGTTTGGGQRLSINPYTGAVQGSYGAVQAPTTSTHEVLGKDDQGNTVAQALTSTRTPVVSSSIPSMPVAGQQPVQPAATPAQGVGGTLKSSKKGALSPAETAAPKGQRVLQNFTPMANLGQNDLESQAQMLANGQMAPSEIKGGRGDAGRILARANELRQQNGQEPLNVAQADIDYSFLKSPKTQETLSYLNSVDKSLNRVSELSHKINRTNFPLVNSAEFKALAATGDTDEARYVTAVTEVADQVAKILQGGGNTTSDKKMQQALDVLNGTGSKAVIDAKVDELKHLLANRKAGLTEGRTVGSSLKKPTNSKSLDDEIMKAIGGK